MLYNLTLQRAMEDVLSVIDINHARFIILGELFLTWYKIPRTNIVRIQVNYPPPPKKKKKKKKKRKKEKKERKKNLAVEICPLWHQMAKEDMKLEGKKSVMSVLLFSVNNSGNVTNPFPQDQYLGKGTKKNVSPRRGIEPRSPACHHYATEDTDGRWQYNYRSMWLSISIYM